MSSISWDCRDPKLGILLESYLEGGLEDAAKTMFEEHYFTCPGCLAEVRFRQSLASALEARKNEAGAERSESGVTGRRRPLLWILAASAALAAGLAAVFFLKPATPFVLQLDGTLRGGAVAAKAPAGRPLDLSLLVPVASIGEKRYDVFVRNETGTVVFSAAAVPPAGRTTVRIRVPVDKLNPGSYVVTLSERSVGGAPPLELRYSFVVASSGSR